jgi:predicted DsbA family dithiol-disulfide isomerase
MASARLRPRDRRGPPDAIGFGFFLLLPAPNCPPWHPTVVVQNLTVQIWSDIACPWCYVGKRRLESAISALPWRSQIRVLWRAFELDPSASRAVDTSAVPYAEKLARKYGTSTAQGQAMIDRMVGVGAAEGIHFRFDRIRPGNSFDAHRLVHLAHEQDKQDAMKERFLRAYLCEGESMSDRETLTRLAVEVGLDEREVIDALSGDAYADAVRADEALARKYNISGVPFFVIADRYGVSGAQPAETLSEALKNAWQELADVPIEEGMQCGPDGCA